MSEEKFKLFYTTKQAAEFMNMDPARLANLRYKGEGPIFYRPGGTGHPQYEREDLIAWMRGGTK